MSPTNTLPIPYQDGRIRIEPCPRCNKIPFSMSVSVRGQMFCECGMELRTSFSPKDTISNRLCELIYRWNRRRIGQSKANINGKVFDPCPFCGSNKLMLDLGAPAISCRCGMRFKLEQKDVRIPTVDELLLEWNRKIPETEGVEA